MNNERDVHLKEGQQTEEEYSQVDHYLYGTPALRASYSGVSNNSDVSFYLHTAFSFEENMKFLSAEEVVCQIEKLLRQLQKKMTIDENLILCLLHKYQWNQQKLEHNYYVSQVEKYQERNKMLQHIERQRGLESCKSCSICQIESPLLKADFCSHQYCLQCWRHYIKQKLINNELFFSCMDSCNDCPILQPFIRFTDKQLIQLYYQKLAMNYCLANKNISYCPSPQCSTFCKKLQIISQSKVQCTCGNIYCFYCRKQVHFPLKCPQVTQWQLLQNKQSYNHQWININTTVCPHCKNNVQKSLGCNYIKCFCGCQFCFNCSNKWDEDHKVKKQCTKQSKKTNRKSNAHQNILFSKAYEKVISIKCNKKNDIKTIEECLKVLSLARSDHKYENKLSNLKSQLKQSWTTLKWGIVGNYLYGESQLMSHLQNQLQSSIKDLMDKIKYVLKFHSKMSPKEVYSAINEIEMKKESMIKCVSIFMQEWR